MLKRLLNRILRLGRLLIILALVETACTDRIPSEHLHKLYAFDTVNYRNIQGQFSEYGLLNLKDSVRTGIWYKSLDGDLIELSTYQNGVKNGPIVGYATGKKGTRIVYIGNLVDGRFDGPTVRVFADSSLNIYRYYENGSSVKELSRDRVTTPDSMK